MSRCSILLLAWMVAACAPFGGADCPQLEADAGACIGERDLAGCGDELEALERECPSEISYASGGLLDGIARRGLELIAARARTCYQQYERDPRSVMIAAACVEDSYAMLAAGADVAGLPESARNMRRFLGQRGPNSNDDCDLGPKSYYGNEDELAEVNADDIDVSTLIAAQPSVLVWGDHLMEVTLDDIVDALLERARQQPAILEKIPFQDLCTDCPRHFYAGGNNEAAQDIGTAYGHFELDLEATLAPGSAGGVDVTLKIEAADIYDWHPGGEAELQSGAGLVLFDDRWGQFLVDTGYGCEYLLRGSTELHYQVGP